MSHYCLVTQLYEEGHTLRVYGPFKPVQKDRFNAVFPKLQALIEEDEDCKLTIFGWCQHLITDSKLWTIKEDLFYLASGEYLTVLESDLAQLKSPLMRKSLLQDFKNKAGIDEYIKNETEELKRVIRTVRKRTKQAQVLLDELKEVGV